jgi:hypothetical protein
MEGTKNTDKNGLKSAHANDYRGARAVGMHALHIEREDKVKTDTDKMRHAFGIGVRISEQVGTI